MAVMWVWRDRKNWARFGARRRLALSLAVASLAGGVYAGTARLVEGFSSENMNGVHMYGIVSWLTTQFDFFVLAEFLVRAVVPLLIPLAFLVGIAPYWNNHDSAPGSVPTLLFGSLCICAQPLLAGPYLTGGAGPRLITLGLLPLCLALAIKLRDAGVSPMRAVLAASHGHRAPCTGVDASLVHHPRIPIFGQRAPFATVYALACAGIFVITLLEARSAAAAAGRMTRQLVL